MSWKKGTKARLIPFTKEEFEKIENIANTRNISFVKVTKELIKHSLKYLEG